MGVEASVHVVVGDLSEGVRELARKHEALLPPPAQDGASAQDLAREFFRAIACAPGSVAAWGMTGKWVSNCAAEFGDLAKALEGFVLELHRDHPDIRLIASYETDHDGEDRAAWFERAIVGSEEGAGPPCWNHFNLAFRVHPSEEPEEDDGVHKPSWETFARHVWVLACDAWDRPAFARKVRDRAQSASPIARACLEGLAVAASQEDVWPAWSPDSKIDAPIDVAELFRALRGLGTVLVGYQPARDRAKVARLDEGVMHYDLPFGVVWSPALVAASARMNTSARANETESAAPAASARESPLRANVLAALETTSMIGLIEQPVFKDLLARPPEERRLLACDLACRPPGSAVGQNASTMVILLLGRADLLASGDDVAELLAFERYLPVGALLSQLERFIAKGPLPQSAAHAIVASQNIATLAAQAPPKADRHQRKEYPWRAREILRAAQGEPPFILEAWAEKVHEDLARMPAKKQKRWRELFAVWDESPPPYVVSRAYRDDLASRLRDVDDAPALACAWLSGLARSDGDACDDLDERLRRNVAVLEGLLLVAELGERVPLLDLLPSLVHAAFAQLRSGCTRCPRLGYRAVDALARLGASEAIRQAAAATVHDRVRSYLLSLAR